jgi:signal transduction histidine kinase
MSEGMMLGAALVLAVVAFLVGRRAGVGAGIARGRAAGLEAGLAEGREAGLVQGREEAEGAAAARIASASAAAESLKGTVGRLEVERDHAADSALARVAAYLDANVAEPLDRALSGGAVKPAARAALDAVEDLQFFIRELEVSPASSNLVEVVQDTAREFTQDWEMPVRIQAPAAPVRARVDPEALKDALFLLLANAGHFAEGGVEVDVDEVDGSARIFVRDRGPGFSPQALQQGMDPFFTTRPGGLGLGLPFARRIVRELQGEIALRNRSEGGAEVEIRFPSGG